MASLAEHLAASPGIEDVISETEVVELLGEPVGRGSAGPWVLKDAEGREHGPFDVVVVALAAPQAARLLAEAYAPAGAARRAGEARRQLLGDARVRRAAGDGSRGRRRARW